MALRVHKGVARIHPLSFKKNLARKIIIMDELLSHFISEQKINERYVYICSPLKATKKKSGKDHILESLKAASQISGASYKRKRLLLFIPHLHGLSIFNEFLHPEKRDHGIQFTINFTQILKPIIVVAGNVVSDGMKGELDLAQKHNLPVFQLNDFKSMLKNLPIEKKLTKSLIF